MKGRPAITFVACLILLVASPPSVRGDEPVRPSLLGPTVPDDFFSRPTYVESGALTYQSSDSVKVEPLLGVGHETHRRDYSLYAGETTHSFTAQAGGRLSILEGLYLSAAVKYPLYTYQRSTLLPAGATRTPAMGTIDLLTPTAGNLNWTGEVGTNLGKGMKSFLYYDKVTSPLMGTQPGHPEDRVGIRFQIDFK